MPGSGVGEAGDVGDLVGEEGGFGDVLAVEECGGELVCGVGCVQGGEVGDGAVA